jgi:DNA-binding NtrC family response regulator
MKKTILVVDDDSGLLKIAELVLTDGGFNVLLTSNARDGLAILKSQKVDLVITDIIMPEIEGIELITKLKRNHPALPIMAISGGGWSRNTDFLKFARKLGAKVVLAKPFRRDALLDAVNRALAN